MNKRYAHLRTVAMDALVAITHRASQCTAFHYFDFPIYNPLNPDLLTFWLTIIVQGCSLELSIHLRAFIIDGLYICQLHAQRPEVIWQENTAFLSAGFSLKVGQFLVLFPFNPGENISIPD
jgi:hypothetical protein